MNLEIISPDKKIYSGDVKSIIVPGVEGSFGILNRHAAMISTLKAGKIKIVDAAQQHQSFDINGGVVEVNNNKVIILAE